MLNGKNMKPKFFYISMVDDDWRDNIVAFYTFGEKSKQDFQDDVIRLMRETGSEYLEKAQNIEYICAQSGIYGWAEYIIPKLEECGYFPVEYEGFIDFPSRLGGELLDMVGKDLFLRSFDAFNVDKQTGGQKSMSQRSK